MKSILHVCAIAIFVTLVSRSGFAQVSSPGKTVALQAYEQGHYEDAEKFYLHAIDETNKSKADTSNMAVLLNNLAVVYVAENRWADASSALRQAVELCEKKTPTANDLGLAASFNKLGKVYQSQSKYADAERLLKTALAIREQIVGPANSATATSLDSLANLYVDEGKYAEALTLRGLIKMSSGRLEDARTDLEQAVQSDGNYAWGNIYISESELRLGIGEHFYDPGGRSRHRKRNIIRGVRRCG